MKKIRASHSDKDRIVFVSTPRAQSYYYQPAGCREQYWLLDTDFSIFVLTYFREHGAHICGRSYSMMLGELHRCNDYHNFKLRKLMERLPAQIDYVILHEMTGAGSGAPCAC